MTRIGFVGLGSMGSALAGRLLTGDEPLTVFDIDREKVLELATGGAHVAASLRDLAESSEVVLICLPTSEHVEAAIYGADGLAEGLRSGALVVDCTSGHPDVTRSIAQRLKLSGVSFVDAPVSGGPQRASEGTIAILVGGESADVTRAEEVLTRISAHVQHVGGVGAGHTVKLLNNVLAAGHRLLAFEMTAIAAASGVEPATFIDAVNLSSGRSYATEVTMPRHVFGPELVQGFSLGLMAKDVRLGCTLIPKGLEKLSLAAGVNERLADALGEFGPTADINEIIASYESAIGAPVVTSIRPESRL
ncbi:3-hydroxyisobutyrate dehydrogenase [Rhodococcus sp. 27YEA15]|uniref:NAD(P)-dependent oxidoreductase n=1 Tax=Rhodococcus sp. 27YEA15 TaxID=3156259 RepID=UPI003C7E5899